MSHKITVFRGDGIGPELVDNVLKILKAADAPLEYEIFNVGEDEWKRNGALIPEEAYASFERTKVLLKSPITTPVGKGFRSLNVTLRGQYDLYANIRPVKSNAAVKTPFENVDIVIFRENTEGLYVGVEEQVNPDTVHAIKIVTRQASERIIRDAFEYAKKNGRKKVTCIHKANILKMSDGMFLSIFKEIAKEYPEIEGDDKIIDNTCADAKRKASAKLWLDMLFKHCAIFDVCGFADFSFFQAKPFVAVISKSMLCRIGWNGLSIHQCGFIFRNLFLRFTVCFSVAKAIFDFSGKLVSFDIACLPSTIFPMENVFSFCHFNYLRQYFFRP